jgi:hypothetical protein
VVFVGAVAALPTARVMYDGSPARFSGSIPTFAVLMAVGSVTALVVSIWRMVTSAGSHLCHVFCSTYLFRCGLVLSAVALSLAVSCLSDEPFHQLLSTGRISPLAVVEASSAVAVAACLAAASVAFINAWDELQNERQW